MLTVTVMIDEFRTSSSVRGGMIQQQTMASESDTTRPTEAFATFCCTLTTGMDELATCDTECVAPEAFGPAIFVGRATEANIKTLFGKDTRTHRLLASATLVE